MKYLGSAIFVLLTISIFPQLNPALDENMYLLNPPTDQNITKPDEVLVVFNSNLNSSNQLALSYCQQRNIPLINLIGVQIPDIDSSLEQKVGVYYEGECIIDLQINDVSNHSWQFFDKHIVEPINNYLKNFRASDGSLLKNKIKYIVMVKGTPYKITPFGDYSGSNRNDMTYISGDALLALMNQEDTSFSILSLFGKDIGYIPNPYFDVDKSFEGRYRFVSNLFKNDSIRLSYCVSRLASYSYPLTFDLINKNINPDRSGNNIFVMDATSLQKPGAEQLKYDINIAKSRLSLLGYDYFYDLSDINYFNFTKKVIGYTSNGTHNLMPTNYPFLIHKPTPGAIVNTYESFTAFFTDSLNVERRQGGSQLQPVVAEFQKAGFSGGIGNAYEPTTETVPKNYVLFPAYAAGYNMVEASYMSLPYLGYRQVVYGDPFVTISYGRQSLIANTTLQDTTLIMGLVTIPRATVLTLKDNSVIKLKHYGMITNSGGSLAIGQNVKLLVTDWKKSLIVGNVGTNPKLKWGRFPDLTKNIYYYKIYVKDIGGVFVYLDSTFNEEYIDITRGLMSNSGYSRTVEYKISAVYVEHCNEGQPCTLVETDFSNSYSVLVAGAKLDKSNSGESAALSYSMTQNYPNPFNPITSIRYQVPERCNVKITIYDVLGNEITELINETKEAGNHEVSFDASQLSSGIYLYKVQAGNFVQSKKMTLLK